MAVFEFIEGWYNPHRRHSPSTICRPPFTKGFTTPKS